VAGAATPALAELAKAGVPHEILRFKAVSELSASGDIAPDQVFKTLIVALPGELAVAIVPVPSRLSLKATAAALGAAKAGMAEPAAAERATGYVAGGISPLGQRRRLPVVVDASALGFATVFCSAGRRGLEIELAPADLVRATGATVAPIGKV
jgi:Cys-tRNA(Pro)/Cys-tRNA(Cys) deacylase